MTKPAVVEKILVLLEEYYCRKDDKYRIAVKNNLRDYLMDLEQDLIVALFEEVKRRHSTQFREPPCMAVFIAIKNEYESEIMHALENYGQGVKLKSLLRPRPAAITEGSPYDLTEKDEQEIADTLGKFKKKIETPAEPKELEIF
jgi:hypothetical protein